MGLVYIVVFVLVLTHYGEIISLYESLQSGLVGGIALTVGQLPIVPNVVVWAASWIVGPGFSWAREASCLPSEPSWGSFLPFRFSERCPRAFRRWGTR